MSAVLEVMASKAGLPLSTLPSHLCLDDAYFNHVGKRPADSAMSIYFDRLAVYADSRKRKRKTHCRVVVTVCTPPPKNEAGAPASEVSECLHSSTREELDAIDENTRLLGGEIVSCEKTNGLPTYRIMLVGTCRGGTQVCSVALCGHVTITQLPANQYITDCLRHRRESGPTAGQRYWQQIVNKVLEENFTSTVRLLLAES